MCRNAKTKPWLHYCIHILDESHRAGSASLARLPARKNNRVTIPLFFISSENQKLDKACPARQRELLFSSPQKTAVFEKYN